MADPRSATRRTGARPTIESYPIDGVTIVYDATKSLGCVSEGLAVKLSGNNQIALAEANDPVLGRLIHVESDGVAAVQTGGYMTLPAGNGATVTAGTKIVGALGASSAKGYIKTADAATLAQVAAGRGLIIDSSTATAVEVLF